MLVPSVRVVLLRLAVVCIRWVLNVSFGVEWYFVSDFSRLHIRSGEVMAFEHLDSGITLRVMG